MSQTNIIKSIVLLAVPPMNRFGNTLEQNPWQIQYSYYMLIFQIPYIGPLWFKNGGFEKLYQTWDTSIIKDEQRLQHLKEFWKMEGRAEHAIMYYKSQPLF